MQNLYLCLRRYAFNEVNDRALSSWMRFLKRCTYVLYSDKRSFLGLEQRVLRAPGMTTWKDLLNIENLTKLIYYLKSCIWVDSNHIYVWSIGWNQCHTHPFPLAYTCLLLPKQLASWWSTFNTNMQPFILSLQSTNVIAGLCRK